MHFKNLDRDRVDLWQRPVPSKTMLCELPRSPAPSLATPTLATPTLAAQPVRSAEVAAALSHWGDERPLAAAAAQGQLREAIRRRQTLGLRGFAAGGTHAEGVALRLGRLSAARQASPPGAAAESQDPYAGATTLKELLGGQGGDAEQTPVEQNPSADPYAGVPTLNELLGGQGGDAGQAPMAQDPSADPYAGATTLKELLGGQAPDAGQAPMAQDPSADPYADATTLKELLGGQGGDAGQAPVAQDPSADPYAGAPTLKELLGGQGGDAGQAPVAQDPGADPYAEAQTLANLLRGTESDGGQATANGASPPPMHDASATASGASRSDLALLRSMVSANQPGHLPFTDQEKNSTGWALRGCGTLGSQLDNSKGVKYYYPQGSLSDSAQQRQQGSVHQKDRRDRFRLEFQKGLLYWQGAKAHTLNANIPPMFSRRAEFLCNQYHQLAGTKFDPNAKGVTQEELAEINRLFPGQVDDMLATMRRHIFVMSGDGQFFAGPAAFDHRHHSSFLAGGAVAAAGEMLIENGQLKRISNSSGHYRPTPGHLWQALAQLQNQGVDVSSAKVELFDVPGKIPASEFLQHFDPRALHNGAELFKTQESLKYAKDYQAKMGRFVI